VGADGKVTPENVAAEARPWDHVVARAMSFLPFSHTLVRVNRKNR
jgi:hypothetical protein